MTTEREYREWQARRSPQRQSRQRLTTFASHPWGIVFVLGLLLSFGLAMYSQLKNTQPRSLPPVRHQDYGWR